MHKNTGSFFALQRALALLVLFATAPATMAAQAAKAPPTPQPSGAMSISKQGYFFVGGQYTETKDGQKIMVGQMYVQYQIPQTAATAIRSSCGTAAARPAPISSARPTAARAGPIISCARVTRSTSSTSPARARSGYFTDAYGPTRRPNATAMSERFTVPEISESISASRSSTRNGRARASPAIRVFDQFFASQVEDMSNLTMIEDMNRNAGVALLDKIGPSIVLTHSQSGPFGWEVADSAAATRQRHVLRSNRTARRFTKASISARPNGSRTARSAARWGITRMPLSLRSARRRAERPR